MFCTECGKKLEENARFCGECGTPVKYIPVLPPPLEYESIPKEEEGRFQPEEKSPLPEAEHIPPELQPAFPEIVEPKESEQDITAQPEDESEAEDEQWPWLEAPTNDEELEKGGMNYKISLMLFAVAVCAIVIFAVVACFVILGILVF